MKKRERDYLCARKTVGMKQRQKKETVLVSERERDKETVCM